MVNVGVMVGSAIFLTAGDVARALPHPLAQLGMWVVAAVFSLAGALTIAELGAAMPQAGGLTVYLGEAFGKFWGFLYGWSLFTVIQTAAIAAVAVAFATYASHFLPLSPLGVQLLAAAVVALLTAINALGVREGVLTQNVFTVAKLAAMLGLVALALAGALFGDSFAGSAERSTASWANLTEAPPGAASFTWVALGAAALGPLFAFDGWITTSYLGGEVKRPARTLPLAALASVAVVAVLYVAVNGAYLLVLGSAEVARAPRTAARTAEVLLGPRGADLAALLVVVATFGALNGNILAGARVLYALAQEGLFWRRVARVHPRFGTPAAALAAQGLVSAALVFTGRFDQLLASCLFASWLFYALGGIAVFVLRRRSRIPPATSPAPATGSTSDRPYRVWGYPVVPALFIAFALALLAATVAAAPRDAAVGLFLLLTGVPAYFLFKRSTPAP